MFIHPNAKYVIDVLVNLPLVNKAQYPYMLGCSMSMMTASASVCRLPLTVLFTNANMIEAETNTTLIIQIGYYWFNKNMLTKIKD